MSDADTLRQAARIARRVPGYRRLRRVLVPNLRRNQLLRTVAHRLWAVRRPTAKKARQQALSPSDVTPGTLIAGIGTENLPVVCLVVPGATAEEVRAVVDETAAEQLVTAGFRPVFVLDQAHFGPLRRYGYIGELVLAPADWAQPTGYQDYLDRRFASIRDTFGVRAWITVSGGRLDGFARAQLRNLRP